MSTTTERKAAATPSEASGGASSQGPAPGAGGLAGRVVRGVLSVALLLALVVGIPIALWAFGVPLLGGDLSWARFVSVMSTPDVTGEVVLSLVTVVGWVAWATFALAVLVEFVAVVRGVRAPRLRGLGLQQRLAAVLVGAVVAMVLATPTTGEAVASSQVVDPVDGRSADPVASSVLESHPGDGTADPTAGSTPANADRHGGQAAGPEASPVKLTKTRAETKAESARASSDANRKTYTVQPGDSLWRIAQETLGDGTRFKEIAHLNYGAQQDDGRALDGSHWVRPGWVLTLPDDASGPSVHQAVDAAFAEDLAPAGDVAPVSEVRPAGTRDVTVQRGDTLWGIAEEELGDGAKYPELYEASRSTTQPDGRRLTDPDLIYPGWQVTVPAADEAETSASDVEPAPEPDTGESGSGTGAGDVADESGDAGADPASDADAAGDAAGDDTAGDPATEEDGASDGDASEGAGPVGEQVDEPVDEDALDEGLPSDEVPADRSADRPADEAGEQPTADGAAAEETTDPAPRGAQRGEKETVPTANEQSGSGDDGASSPGSESAPEEEAPALDKVEDLDTETPEIEESAPATEGAGARQDDETAAAAVPPGGAVDEASGQDDVGTPGEGRDQPDTAGTTDAHDAPAYQEVTPDDLAGEPSLDPAAAAAPDIAESAPTTQGPAGVAAPESSEAASAAAPQPEPAISAALVDASLSDELLEAFDVRTAAGVGGLLAAGILTLLAARRDRARRRRRPGERIALPAPGSPSAELETDLRAVSDKLGREQVDIALRTLAGWHRERGLALPGVRVARLKSGEFIELYLDRAAELPPPWVSTTDRYVWQLPAGENPAVASDKATPDLMESPYPSLVTLGHDDEDAHLMVDLENVGCLDIRGSDIAAQATLAALAVELATSLWADDLQVTVVGALSDLPGVVDTGRIRHVPSVAGIVRELEARAADVDRTLAQVGAVDLSDARGRGLAMDAWTPEILLVGESMGTAERTRLEGLVERVPGVGIAAVTSSAEIGEWMLDLSGELTGGDKSRGVLVPAYIAVRPQQLDADTYVQALELLGDPEPVAGPAWARNLAPEEPELVEPEALPDFDEIARTGADADAEVVAEDVVEAPVAEKIAVEVGAGAGGGVDARPTSGSAGAAAVDLAGDPTGSDVAPVPVTPVGPDGPDAGEGAGGWDDGANPWVKSLDEGESAADENGTLDTVATTTAVVHDDLEVPEEPQPARTPVVRVLGTVELAGCAGTDLPASHQRQAMELVAFLAFNPGARGSDISRALWPSREPNLATRRSAVSRARRWLGTDAYGFEYLPRYWSTDDGSQVDQEKAGYRLRGVTTDWDLFCELVGPDLTAAPLDDLRRALELVRGVPFQDTPPRKYVWAEVLMQEMAAGVVDVAHEVSRRGLAEGDLAVAREASRVGRIADPADERSWRNSIRTEYASGRMDAAGRLIDRLRDHLEQLDMEPEPETEELISEIDAAGKDR
ncbi:LysM peptidoglycan-binding domain-containing protein [Myceligenerans pegani]|uniref:LysM peptidoglycan-binding domain-containing protein n=1 Tax=Myceligenerans pegani TaxID=2776917 RepID=A0ABR9N1L2_9MICO|nr:LysM peptidoglycan-binding domain-containing protein [Myceligenerans sp. TRM 65318]MBE1877546.1 LysM peptidoglycan-binding domain-containing protein [Myceligenerans sp. TRM 65318]MBE3019817.1 LysM peptidoglycan-binding domain-containing protein [Myceligenerans sp. TRM 65318]